MTVEELLFFGKQSIHSDHAKILLAENLKKNPLELLLNLEEEVPKEIEKRYRKEIQAIKEGKPIQYAIGNVNFYGISFIINENVLIPRFETEELVEKTIEIAKKQFPNKIDILDLGCGSGVIGLTLEKKLSTNSVDLVDISKEALEVAKTNAKNLNSKADFIESDMLEKITKKYDIIISNPPYIKLAEEIEEIVKNNEPKIALYGGEDGLEYYRKILQKIKFNMKEKCLIAFEIGMTQAEEIKQIANKNLENIKIEVKKDLSGKERMLFIFKNCE